MIATRHISHIPHTIISVSVSVINFISILLSSSSLSSPSPFSSLHSAGEKFTVTYCLIDA